MKRALFIALLCGGLWVPARSRGQVAPGTFIRDWQICGPFPAGSVLDPVVENEAKLEPLWGQQTGGKDWKLLESPTNSVDLESAAAFGMLDNAVAYAFAEIESDTAGDAILGLGSDDSIMAWWNARPVLVQDVLRGLKLSQDQVVVKMERGKNTLLLKIFDAGGGWGFAADLQPIGGGDVKWGLILPLDDDEMLELVERKAFDYFWLEANPLTGLIPDSVPVEPRLNDAPCSIAAVGFGLTAICIGDARGWVAREKARARVVRTLKMFLEKVPNEHGFFYHWVDWKTGERAWDCEVSSIDTALLLAGVLTCRSYFNDREITELADRIYRNVDWPWMLDGGETLRMSWKPESGFGPARWGSYCEHMILYLLAIGSPTHPLPASSWDAWKRPTYAYGGKRYIQGVPLFLHQYSHAWVDFRGRRDAYADYFKNSELATRAHREYCLSLQPEFPTYTSNCWGLTASVGPDGYMIWGGPPSNANPRARIDGSIVPCAAAGSLPFAPDIVVPVIRELHEKRPEAWGRYGFVDAFNPATGWVASRYLGIDLGATLLMIENRRTGDVWKWFMDNVELQNAMQAAGFKRTGRAVEKADEAFLRKLARETWDCIAYFVFPATGMPYDSSARAEHTSATNVGLYLAALAAARDMGFLSAAEALDRATRLLDSIEKFPAWKGFAQCWHGVADLKPAAHDIWVSVVDTGNLAMGLVVAEHAFPELAARCKALLDAMDWAALYDANAGQLYGGYDMVNGKFNPDWRIDALATDSRGAAFMAVASGKVPPDVWSNLRREAEEQYHVKFLKPGWTGGGLFMQYLTGIFLDEKSSLAGRSAANLAYQNMRVADEHKLPAWGWSACQDPDGGYLGWGKLRNEVVTPHASVLAIEDFPAEVMANLYELQRRGARAPWEEGGKSYPFGFRDSVNLVNGHVAKDYLVLDQGMLFLSLANFLENGLVRRYFHADPGVQEAVKKIAELASPEGGPNVSVCEPGLGQLIVAPTVGRKLDVWRMPAPPAMDGNLADWPAHTPEVIKYPDHYEFGVPPNKGGFSGAFRFAWDSNNLYVAVDVQDDELVAEKPAEELYKDDGIELFLDPKNDGFVWGNAADFQIGLSPSGAEGKPQIYAFFQKTVPAGAEIGAVTEEARGGAHYVVEARIPWSALGVSGPQIGQVIPASVALHTVDKARMGSAKINWSYRTEGDQIRLGELRLVE